MERSDVRSFYLLAAFLACAYALPFVVGFWFGTARADERWFGYLATVVVSGILQGGVYAMFAVGLTLIFGVMRIINAAHGEMVMMGAYLTWVSFFYLGVNPLLSLVLTLPIAFLFGVVVQRLLLDAVVGQPELTALLVTFRLGLTMIYVAELIFTTDFRTIPYAPHTIQITKTIAVGQNKVISFVMAVAISAGVYLFLKLSRLGKAIRATALNAEVAMVCGIDVRRIYLITTGLGSALAVPAARCSRTPRSGACISAVRPGARPRDSAGPGSPRRAHGRAPASVGSSASGCVGLRRGAQCAQSVAPDVAGREQAAPIAYLDSFEDRHVVALIHDALAALILRGDADLTVLLVHVDANTVHGWPLLSAPVERGGSKWASLCHHAEWGASRFIPSMPPTERRCEGLIP